jgi:predicted CoA-binding protein
MRPKTLLIGASSNPARYSFKAIELLLQHGYPCEALALRPGQIGDLIFHVGTPHFDAIDTVTLYINAAHQASYIDYIISLKPRRIIFNPGTENPDLVAAALKNNIHCELACTLVLLQTGQYD